MKVQAIIKKGKEIYRDRNARTRYILHFSLAANIAFALLELAEGLFFGSIWLIAIGVYYAVLGVMRFSLLSRIFLMPPFPVLPSPELHSLWHWHECR